jgi:hypothetical protein
MYDKETASGNEKMSWTKRFPMQKQQFILFASTSANKVVPKAPAEEYLALLESKKEHAHSMVQHGITIQRGGTQAIDHPFASSLYSGILYNLEGNGIPKGISTFLSVPAPIIGGKAAMGADELKLRIEAQKLSEAQIKELTKSQVQIPTDGNGVRSTLENHMYTFDYLFGKESHLHTMVATLYAGTIKHKRAFDVMTMNNPEYVASLLQAVDVKVQLFFESCASAKTVDEVDYEVLDFKDEITSFKLRQPLNTQLPVLVQQIVNAAKAPQTPTGNNTKKGKNKITPDDLEEKNKRKKPEPKGDKDKGPADLNAPVINASPIDPTWIKQGEPMKIFHDHLDKAPKYKGKPLCINYHIKGMCSWGEGCRRKASHTSNLDEETKTKIGEWVKMCRDLAEEGKN